MSLSITIEAYGDDFKTALKYLQRAISDTADSCSMSDGGYGIECQEMTDGEGLKTIVQSVNWSKLKKGE